MWGWKVRLIDWAWDGLRRGEAKAQRTSREPDRVVRSGAFKDAGDGGPGLALCCRGWESGHGWRKVTSDWIRER